MNIVDKFACQLCGAEGSGNFLTRHLMTEHGFVGTAQVGGEGRPKIGVPFGALLLGQKKSNNLGEALSRSLVQAKGYKKNKKEKARLLAEAKRLNSIQGGMKAAALLADVHSGNRCFLCNALMAHNHMKTHRNLKKSVSPSPRAQPSTGDGSIWAVSGGLPSLGKRSR